ncbi:MAG: ATP-binding cassette domain-containing protein [Acidobacteriota bacterium]|nr:ATP-binding cassette domain-containing protein [Acidobacteriota bacterium]MDH3784252.1 ATP-binding cassette domain-containing protein [Acidobacteriota bacterium]
MNAAVSLRGLRKTFGDHRAVDDLSFDVPEGTIFGLLGRNGAGKSTTIRMIMDIIRPDTGEIQVFGHPMAGEVRDRIGYLPEERGLFPKMKVIDAVEFLGSISGLSIADARKAGNDWLDRLELGKWKTHKVEELSKGMQQKVQFAAAVLTRPSLLILDEPFSGMDPVNQDIFKDLMLEINRSGTTIIFSTHVMASAERLCREIALIDQGKAVLNGSLASIKEKFGNNSIQLEFDGNADFLSSLSGIERIDRYERYVELLLADSTPPRTVLEAAIAHVEIKRFEIMTPTLHNIFIQQVGQEPSDA